jgi:hypothetical protein
MSELLSLHLPSILWHAILAIRRSMFWHMKDWRTATRVGLFYIREMLTHSRDDLCPSESFFPPIAGLSGQHSLCASRLRLAHTILVGASRFKISREDVSTLWHHLAVVIEVPRVT